jgi:hypothetical protein
MSTSLKEIKVYVSGIEATLSNESLSIDELASISSELMNKYDELSSLNASKEGLITIISVIAQVFIKLIKNIAIYRKSLFNVVKRSELETLKDARSIEFNRALNAKFDVLDNITIPNFFSAAGPIKSSEMTIEAMTAIKLDKLLNDLTTAIEIITRSLPDQLNDKISVIRPFANQLTQLTTKNNKNYAELIKDLNSSTGSTKFSKYFTTTAVYKEYITEVLSETNKIYNNIIATKRAADNLDNRLDNLIDVLKSSSNEKGWYDKNKGSIKVIILVLEEYGSYMNQLSKIGKTLNMNDHYAAMLMIAIMDELRK